MILLCAKGNISTLRSEPFVLLGDVAWFPVPKPPTRGDILRSTVFRWGFGTPLDQCKLGGVFLLFFVFNPTWGRFPF